MTYPLKGLVLHLHSALANQGVSQGVNSIPVSTWFDLTRRGHSGILTNFNFSQDKAWTGNNLPSDPYSLYFNGLNNYAVIPKHSEFLPTDPGFTFETWVRPVKSGYIVSYGTSSEQGFSLYFDLNSLELRAQVNTPTKRLFFVFSDISVKSWQHVTLIYDGSRLWGILNAAPQGFSLPVNENHNVTNYNLTLGKNSASNNDYFEGNIATFRVYNRALDWEEVSESYNSGFIITSSVSDMPSRFLVLWRDDLTSTLNVSMTTRLHAKYDTVGFGYDDLSGTAQVKRPSDLSSSLDINPRVSLSVKYDVENYGSDDLQSSISVCRHDNLPSSLAINPYTKLVGHYDVEEVHLSDLTSSLEVSSFPSQIWSYITVDLKEVGLSAKFDIHKSSYADLGGIIEVEHTNDLPSSIGVNLNVSRYMRVKYLTEPSYINDLQSEINVMSTSDLDSSIQVSVTSFVRARYGTIEVVINDLPSTLTITSTKELSSYITVGLNSRMSAKYNISPIYLSDLPMVLGIKEFDELYGEMFINLRSILRTSYEVTPIYFAWLPSEVTVKAVNDLQSKVFVSKPLVLRARYELTERPNYTVKLYPVKDAFVREFFPKLNYGTEVQMYTGKAGSPFPERYRSFIGFDLLSIPKENTEIGKAVLRLYYDGRGDGTQTVQIIEPNSGWTETGITWANHPMPDMATYNGFSVIGAVGGNAGYVEFDVTSLVRAWHNQEKPNYGLLLKAVDESTNLLKGFYTKEAIEQRPELVVTYYDMQVYSDDYSYVSGELTVKQNKTKDLPSILTVRQYLSWVDLTSSLKVHKPGDLESVIWINRPQVNGSLKVRQKGLNDLSASIVVKVVQIDDLESTISANEKEKPSSIYVLYRDNIDSEITVSRWGDPWLDGGQLLSEIGVSEVNKESSIYVLYRDDLDSVVDVRVWSDDTDPQNNLLIEFEITRSFELLGELNVNERSDIGGSLDIRVEEFTDQPSEIYIKYRDDLYSYGNIGNPRLKSYIDVWSYSLLDGSVTVRLDGISELPSTIDIPLGDTSSIPSTLNLRMMSDIPGSITVLSGNLQSFISIPINGQKDIVSVLNVRVRRVSDLGSNLGIVSGNFYSELSVRVSSYRDLLGNLTVRRSEKDEIPIEGYVRPWVNLFSYIAASKPRYRELYSELNARQTGWNELPGQIAVRVWNDPWTDGGQLDGSISIRVWDTNDQESNIAIRRDDFNDLQGYVQAKQVNDLDTGITVRQFGYSDFNASVAVYKHYELYSDATIRRWGDPEADGGQIPSSITVRQYEEKDLDGLVKVFEHYNVDSTISVRRWGNPYIDGGQIPSSIAIRVWGSKDLAGTVVARQKNASDLWTYIFSVRRSDIIDLPANATIKRVSDIVGSIEVITAYPYAYIM